MLACLFGVCVCGEGGVVVEYIALDGWMIPFPEDYLSGLSTKQPLLFINSDFQKWKENVQSMLKLLKSCKGRGNESCFIITLKYAILNCTWTICKLQR